MNELPPTAASGSAIEVRDLRVELNRSGGADIISGISFELSPGTVTGLVGESGSGKTTAGTAMLGYVRAGARIVAGTVVVDGQNVLAMDAESLRAARGRVLSYVPQDPATALNPSRRIGRELSDLLADHEPAVSRDDARSRISETMTAVGLPRDEEFLRRFPHQLSGGQQQRVCLALAFLLRPKVIVLDEPTTALDVTTQAHVLKTVRSLCAAHRVAALYVTHDIAVVAGLAQRVIVMYAGRIAEIGFTGQVLRRPVHPYTRKLVGAIPDISGRRELISIRGQAPAPGARPTGCAFAPRCHFVIDACRIEEPPLTTVEAEHRASCIRALELRDRPGDEAAVRPHSTRPPDANAVLAVTGVDAYYGQHRALSDVSISLRAGECLAVVGESGSGKTTLARSIVGLHKIAAGYMQFEGTTLAGTTRERSTDLRRRIQYVFQSPHNSLNPRHTIGQSVSMPATTFFNLRRKEFRARVDAALEQVSLPARYGGRYPHELSGGERQRASIARALICEPTVLICDEVTSALDVSVQASIVRLLEELRASHELSMIFVTHNLALVMSIADRVVVMQHGVIVEEDHVQRILTAPQNAYTQQLLADTPRLDGVTSLGNAAAATLGSSGSASAV